MWDKTPTFCMQLASMPLHISWGSIKIQPARRGILESPGSLRKHLMQIWPEYSTYKPKNCSTVKKGLIILMLTNELSFKRPIDEKITLFRSRRIHENEAKKIENRRTKDIIQLEPHLGTYHQLTFQTRGSVKACQCLNPNVCAK